MSSKLGKILGVVFMGVVSGLYGLYQNEQMKKEIKEEIYEDIANADPKALPDKSKSEYEK